MYSLGIVLFELFHPISTDMERVKLLTQLREDPVQLLSQLREGGTAALGPDILETVAQLTAEEPDKRPTADQLLQVSILYTRYFFTATFLTQINFHKTLNYDPCNLTKDTSTFLHLVFGITPFAHIKKFFFIFWHIYIFQCGFKLKF